MNHEVIEHKIFDIGGVPLDVQRREWLGRPLQLLQQRVHVVTVHVGIPQRVDQLPGLQPTDLQMITGSASGNPPGPTPGTKEHRPELDERKDGRKEDLLPHKLCGQ